MCLNQILFDFHIKEALNLIQTNNDKISTTDKADKSQTVEENVMIKENITVNVS